MTTASSLPRLRLPRSSHSVPSLNSHSHSLNLVLPTSLQGSARPNLAPPILCASLVRGWPDRSIFLEKPAEQCRVDPRIRLRAATLGRYFGATRQRVGCESSDGYNRSSCLIGFSRVPCGFSSLAFSARRIYIWHHVQGRAQCQERHQGVFLGAGKGPKWYVWFRFYVVTAN